MPAVIVTSNTELSIGSIGTNLIDFASELNVALPYYLIVPLGLIKEYASIFNQKKRKEKVVFAILSNAMPVCSKVYVKPCSYPPRMGMGGPMYMGPAI